MTVVFEWLERIGECLRSGAALHRGSGRRLTRVQPWGAGLGYAVPLFRERGINTPLALMNITEEDFEAGASGRAGPGRAWGGGRAARTVVAWMRLNVGLITPDRVRRTRSGHPQRRRQETAN